MASSRKSGQRNFGEVQYSHFWVSLCRGYSGAAPESLQQFTWNTPLPSFPCQSMERSFHHVHRRHPSFRSPPFTPSRLWICGMRPGVRCSPQMSLALFSKSSDDPKPAMGMRYATSCALLPTVSFVLLFGIVILMQKLTRLRSIIQ